MLDYRKPRRIPSSEESLDFTPFALDGGGCDDGGQQRAYLTLADGERYCFEQLCGMWGELCGMWG